MNSIPRLQRTRALRLDPAILTRRASKGSFRFVLFSLVITLLLFHLLTGLVTAQTTMLSETFETNFPEGNGWSIGDANGSGIAAYWDDVSSMFGGEGTHSGTRKGYCAGVGYGGTTTSPTYQNSMSAYMSKGVNLAGVSSATLTFWHKIPFLESCCDATVVYIDNVPVWSSQSPATSWTQVTISLNAYVGGLRTLKFQFESDSSIVGEGWYLDDILITTGATSGPDFVVQSIVLDPETPQPGQSFTATVTVRNQGSVSGDGGDLDVWRHQPSVQGCGAFGDDYQPIGVLPSGATTTRTFSLSSLAAGNYSFRAYVDSQCETIESNEGNNQGTLSYTVGSQPPSSFGDMQADAYFENTLPVSFRFSSLPGTTCFSASCGTVTPACDFTSRSPNHTVDTTFTPCDTENITVTLTADPASGANQTGTVRLTERYHIGCDFTRRLGVSTFDVLTGNPAAASVSVAIIPAQAGTVAPAFGTSARNSLTGQYEFLSTYTANPNYSGRVRVKFATSGNTLIFSFDQNAEISTLFSTTWRTTNDTVSADQYDVDAPAGQRVIQVYRIYLHAGVNYDFSLAAADGVGASCSGNGDLRMYDSSGAQLWSIDGDAIRNYDASTLGTLYEGWSPPSSGYYFLKISEHTDAGFSYTLAYREVLPCADDAFEPDDTPVAARSITDNETQGRRICPGNEDWATFTVDAAGSPVIVRTGPRSGYPGGDTEMWLYGPNNSTTQIAYNNNHDGMWSQITAPALAAGTYYVRVRSWGNDARISGYTLSLDIMPPPPVITTQPVSRTDELGTTATFSVAASGTAPLRYQWRFNGFNNLSDGGRISGAADTTLVIREVRLSDAGSYTVQVTDDANGATTSLSAQLTVGTAQDSLTMLWSTGGVSCLEVSGPAGRVFQLQGSPDLFHWALLGRYTNDLGTLVITNTSPAGWNAHFFRTFVPSDDSPTNGLGPMLGPIQLFPDGSVRLQMTGTPGTAWRLQGSPDLRHWGAYGVVTNAGGSVWISNTPLGQAPRYFFRAAQP